MDILNHIGLKKKGAAGFSLVEVTLALGVIGCAFVPMIGLLPTGLQTFRRTMELSTGIQIAQQVEGEVQQADFSTLGGTSGNSLRYFDEQGIEIADVNSTKWIYVANTVIGPPASDQTAGLQGTGLVKVNIQVIYNPARKVVPVGADGLVSGTLGLAVQNYTNFVSAYK